MGDRQQLARVEDMATTSTAVATVSAQLQEEPVERVAVITLNAPRTETQTRKKVVWTDDTIDNEHMNKKKSKCCCIYEKPHKFGESDSEDSDDECEHCFGHVEKRKMKKAGTIQASDIASTSTNVQVEPEPQEPTVTITLTNEPTPAPAPPDKDGNTAQ